MVDASDLKSVDCYGHASSSLATPTNHLLHNTMAIITKKSKASNAKSNNHENRREFGGLSPRLMRRLRSRQAAKAKRVSSHSDQAARGFA